MLELLVMAPTLDTSSMERIASTTWSVTSPVSAKVASSARATFTVNWVESMSDMKAVPLVKARVTLPASSPKVRMNTRGFTRRAPRSSFS